MIYKQSTYNILADILIKIFGSADKEKVKQPISFQAYNEAILLIKKDIESIKDQIEELTRTSYKTHSTQEQLHIRYSIEKLQTYQKDYNKYFDLNGNITPILMRSFEAFADKNRKVTISDIGYYLCGVHVFIEHERKANKIEYKRLMDQLGA